VSSLIAGYHLAFVIGAAAVGAGILAAVLLLRRRPAREDDVVVLADSTPELERQAA
jgi:hypothetical protein